MVNYVSPNTEKTEKYNLIYFSLFSKISEYLKTSFISKTIHSNNIKYNFIVFVYNPQSKDMLIKYFSKFPLLGQISKDYNSWCEIFLNNTKIDVRNSSNPLGNNLTQYLPNSSLNNKRHFSTSSILKGKTQSNKYLSSCTDLLV
jgi:hypothetical protein